MKVTGDPDMVTQIVRGSEPIFSVVKPAVLVTEPGTVTGILAMHVLPVVVRVTPVIVFAVGSTFHVRLGLQLSLVILVIKAVPMSSCFCEMMGQVVLYLNVSIINTRQLVGRLTA